MADDEDFASVIERAQRSPRSREDIPHDINDLFERPLPRDHRVVRDAKGEKIAGAVEYDYKAHVEYFQIPEQKAEYESILDLILNAEALLRYEDRTFTKEGDCVIVLCYMTRSVNAERSEKKWKVAEDEEREDYLRRRKER